MSETLLGRFRWWLFKKISALGWWVCPEPHRSALQFEAWSWDRYQAAFDRYKAPIQPLKGE